MPSMDGPVGLARWDADAWECKQPWGTEWTAEDINDIDFGFGVVATRSRELARSREAYSRKLLGRRLPRALHWTLDHPRVLRVLLRFVPRWRPTMGIVRLNDLRFLKHGGMAYFTASAAVQAADVWLGEMEARGVTLDGGHVFTYTDASGLPAEVYGP